VELDRVLGGGLVEGSVTLLAGEPGIGKSTLLLQLLGALSAAGTSCLLASGEESRPQVAARARRLGTDTGLVRFAPGRDLEPVLAAALATSPAVLAVDSIQTIRDPAAPHVPGGVAQVRAATDALVGLAKHTGIAVVLTGHVTKDGDLAGPRALEHAVDVVLGFDGDPRSGLRVLSAGKNRFGAEGETAWFEMGSTGLSAVDPSDALRTGPRLPGAATALLRRGRRAVAVEIQALLGSADGTGRRQVTGLDPRRFQLVAAVLDRVSGIPLGRADLFGASSGGLRIDDPGCDLAVAAALASAASGVAPPEGAAFVGEVALTGAVRATHGSAARLAAARAAGCRVVYGPPELAGPAGGPRVIPVGVLAEALIWCAAAGARAPKSLPA
jgi:DNA repair protein RadA/Sms